MNLSKSHKNNQPVSRTSKEKGYSLLQYMPSLLDREINSAEADAFGHQHYAKALESLIEDETNHPPFSVGLLGKWGTGKSSIKSLYLEGLAQDNHRDSRKLTRSQKVRGITFNAWRFGGENIRRALLRHVYLELGGEETVLMDTLFNQTQEKKKVPKGWKEIRDEVYDKWLWTFSQVLVLIGAVILLTLLMKWLFGLHDQKVIASIFAVQSLLLGLLFKYFFDANRFVISRFTPIDRVELPTASAEQFEKLLVDQIAKFQKTNTNCERLVVFVDDLDRLSAEEMVNGLDAIRTFMELPHENKNSEKIGIVFVISCDEDRVADALANKRRNTGADLPGVILTRTDARRYLDRIFQFRLEIPPFPRQDMRSFALEKLQTELPQIVAGIESRGANIEEVVSRMIHVGVQSPRNALHILNAFIESWWIAEHREREGAGSDRRGALSEGSVTKHPLALAALCVLRVDFPDFYGDLQKEPELISCFLEVFVHQKSFSNQPERVRFLLEKYAHSVVGEGSENETRILKDECRPLRQYLTSVASISWPKSLQPLLLLSQDPVSRQLGDGGLRIYDALVSGDTQGVLADLGRDKDERKFDQDQIRLLRDFVEKIDTETDDRRDNANSVLAELVDRYPADDARHLLVPLARSLSRSKSLRSRIGAAKVPSILPFLSETDKKRVVGCYIQDLLLSSSDIEFTLPSGETPSLEEIETICRTTVDFALNIRGEVGLNPTDDKRLLEWLISRNISIAGKTFEFTFTDLEAWVEQHEEHLLNALDTNYLEVVANALKEEENYKDGDIASTARRIDLQLRSLWEQGEESREIVWGYVGRYVRLTPPEVNDVAQRLYREHMTEADSSVASEFIKNASKRVLSFVSEDDLDEIDTDAAHLLITISSSRTDLVVEAVDKMCEVCINLSGYEKHADLAAELASSLIKSYPESSQQVFLDWTERVATDLPQACLKVMARDYKLLNEAVRSKLSGEMTALVGLPAPTDNEGLRYCTLVNGIPGDVFQEEPLQSHFISAMGAISQKYSEVAYLKNILPAVLKIVQYCSKPAVGTMLHSLAANSRNYPDCYQDLHTIMQGYWPKTDAEMAPYDPETVFNESMDFIATNPGHVASGVVLRGMTKLIQDGLIDESKEEELIAAAIVIWPTQYKIASDVLKAIDTLPKPTAVAELMTPIDAEDSEEIKNLQNIWQHYIDKFNSDQYIKVVCAIIEHPAKSINTQPDGFLSLWCELIEGDLPSVFKVLSENEQLNVEQKLRVWKQLEKRLTSYSSATVVTLVKRALLCNEETAKSVLDVSSDLVGQFDSKDSKYELATELLTVFPNALNIESKNKIAQWIKSLGNPAILKTLKKGDLDLSDIEILLQNFPAISSLNKLLEE